MASSYTTTTSVADATGEMSAREVLELARAQQRAEDAAAARKLRAAARWADLHPPESIHATATYSLAGIRREAAIPGPVAPGVFEWTSPHGHTYRRDHTGTTRLPSDADTDPDPQGPPRPRSKLDRRD